MGFNPGIRTLTAVVASSFWYLYRVRYSMIGSYQKRSHTLPHQSKKLKIPRAIRSNKDGWCV